MKKLFALALCALSLGFVSCDKDDEEGQDFKEGTILAKVHDNEVFINGKSYGLTEGYAQVENNEYCVLDFGTEGKENEGWGRGIIQGAYMNKEVDLAAVNTEELFIDIMIAIPGNQASAAGGNESTYWISLYKNEKEFQSFEGLIYGYEDQKSEQNKSCFKAGKLKGVMKDKDTVLVTAEGILNSGKEFAIKILYPINQW
ncbi:MAG: hypothetical protein MJY79_04305 [Bacteroidaceae bacterium]|nr:hypothetical protein [Bacteroidaceae bacterium]